MPKNLVIVESPSKAKTIEKYLGKNYKVVATIGHIRDLPKSKLGVDVDNNFEPLYITIRGKGEIVKNLKKESAKADKVFIATDPDREGEAIAWHLEYLLQLDPNEKHRVTFHEITKDAVKNAIKNPRKVDIKLVDSQQARRVLDRLVGYKISPILWRKVLKGLSAGRVQSVALHMIAQREKEIREFISQEYWTFDVELKKDKSKLLAELVKLDNKKVEVDNINKAQEIEDILKDEKFVLKEITNKERNRVAPEVYTTASLQRDASNILNFQAQKTMRIAQSLYEGIKIKRGLEGLITYMRTDSTRISDQARSQVNEFILNNYGKEYTANKKNRNQSGQDAHEGIRVTDVNRTPESLQKYLNRDELKLYTLIWNRFVASQMSDAKVLNTIYNFKSKRAQAKSTGQVLIFDGFLKVLSNKKAKDQILPSLSENDEFITNKVIKEQKFTQPPSRYTEALLIKEMEDNGIGRPSTYAPTITTLTARHYIVKKQKSIYITEIGDITDKLMQEYFSPIIQIDFTAELEKNLDKISHENDNWQDVIREFYNPFNELLTKAEENMQKINLDEVTDIKCDKCGAPMLKKKTLKGEFLGCSNYPECTNIKPILKKIGIKCPKCGNGEIVEKKTKKLKTFWSCDQYPKCDFASWNKPIDRKCPECGSLLAEGNNKMSAFIVCTNNICNYREKKNPNNDK